MFEIPRATLSQYRPQQPDLALARLDDSPPGDQQSLQAGILVGRPGTHRGAYALRQTFEFVEFIIGERARMDMVVVRDKAESDRAIQTEFVDRRPEEFEDLLGAVRIILAHRRRRQGQTLLEKSGFVANERVGAQRMGLVCDQHGRDRPASTADLLCNRRLKARRAKKVVGNDYDMCSASSKCTEKAGERSVGVGFQARGDGRHTELFHFFTPLHDQRNGGCRYDNQKRFPAEPVLTPGRTDERCQCFSRPCGHRDHASFRGFRFFPTLDGFALMRIGACHPLQGDGDP